MRGESYLPVATRLMPDSRWTRQGPGLLVHIPFGRIYILLGLGEHSTAKKTVKGLLGAQGIGMEQNKPGGCKWTSEPKEPREVLAWLTEAAGKSNLLTGDTIQWDKSNNFNG
jgi:hypothetical protein